MLTHTHIRGWRDNVLFFLGKKKNFAHKTNTIKIYILHHVENKSIPMTFSRIPLTNEKCKCNGNGNGHGKLYAPFNQCYK